MESLLFLMDVLVITYLCWRVFKADKATNKQHEQLQLIGYKTDEKP